MATRLSNQRKRELSELNPRTVTYTLPGVDFGAGNSAHAIKAPARFTKGLILDVGVVVSETFTEDTTQGFVRLGSATDADAYAELQMGTAAATDFYNTQDDPDAIINPNVTSTQIEVACIAPTGGTPAGIGDVVIVIDWM